jgi:Glycosyl hydrolase family 59/F5/8 type C domain
MRRPRRSPSARLTTPLRRPGPAAYLAVLAALPLAGLPAQAPTGIRPAAVAAPHPPAAAHAPPATTATTTAGEPATITVDGGDTGRSFDGVGAISASSSKLLHDYPEPERGQILDYLFRPRYGASLHILKVEIGSDANSTVLAEPAHARTADDLACDRGVQWWLMKEAKRRNPDITLSALSWGLPGWVSGGRWSDDHVRYLLDWLTCAERNGLRIDLLGGSNEEYDRPPPGAFYVALKRALAARFPHVRVVATDEHAPPDYWYQATRMKADPAYRDAVDVLGEHDVCVWRSLYQRCHVNQDALDLGKPLWNSEQSSQDVMAGAGPLARAMTRNYIDAKVTGNVNWSLAAGFYDHTEVGGTGLLSAQWPWSGHYRLGPSVWVDAHTAQFTRPGWRYLDGAAGRLPGGATHVALREPGPGGGDQDTAGGGPDYTVVLETMDATAPQTVRVVPAGGLSTGTATVWSTDLASDDPGDWFVRSGTLRPGEPLRLEPGHVYTVSTTTGQRKGTARPRVSEPSLAPLPWRQDFEATPHRRSAGWFQDVAGAFEAAPCAGGRDGACYRQVVERQPYLWHSGGATPVTLAGDARWWGDYSVDTAARLDGADAVELLGRVDKYNAYAVAGYHLRLAKDGTWQLFSQADDGAAATLASGAVDVDPGRWYGLRLWFRGDRIQASIDDRTVADVTDDRHRTGQVGLVAGGWHRAEFDDLDVRPTGPAPRQAAPAAVTATSSQPGVVNHHRFVPKEAIDGRIGSWWQSRFDPPAALPQSLTLDLGRVRTLGGLVYWPQVHGTTADAIITGYRVATSTDGERFGTVAAGAWRADAAAKAVTWAPARARYVRLEATASKGGASAAVAELAAMLGPG